MRVQVVMVVLLALVSLAPAAQAALWSATWDPPHVDFDEGETQRVTATHRLVTNCPTEAEIVPVVALSISSIRGSGPPVLYFLDGEEVFPMMPIELGEWTLEPGVVHLWTIERALEFEVVRGPNATIEFEAAQAWIRLVYDQSPCPLVEVAALTTVFGSSERPPILFTASALANETTDEDTILAESPSAALLLPLALMAVLLSFRRRRSE